MARIIAEVTAQAKKKVLLREALQKALNNAPSPPPGTDVQTFRLLSVQLEYGGFTGNTVTRVTLDVKKGQLPRLPPKPKK